MNLDAHHTIRRVLMTSDTVGGVWTYALELCAGLAQHGVEVVLATMGASLRPDQYAQVASLHNVTLRESTFALEWMNDPWDDVAAAGEWLLELEDRFSPDVIHLNGYAHAALPWAAPVLVTSHSCVLSWWRAVRGKNAPSEWNRYAEAVRTGLDAANIVVAPTRWMADALVEHYGLAAPARVIPNGRNARFFTQQDKAPFVLSVGRVWDEAKNVRALSAIAPRLKWPVRVVGELRSPDGGEVPLNDTIWLGRLSSRQTAAWYARAAIYALPARYEPFGLSVLEAAMSGCALVLGDIPSLRETWGGAATFVHPDDHEGLRAAIDELIAAPAHRADLGRRARRLSAQYEAGRMTQMYFDTYCELTRSARLQVESRSALSI